MSSKEWPNVKTILRGMFRFAYKNQIIETNLMDDVEITVKFRQVSKKVAEQRHTTPMSCEI